MIGLLESTLTGHKRTYEKNFFYIFAVSAAFGRLHRRITKQNIQAGRQFIGKGSAGFLRFRQWKNRKKLDRQGRESYHPQRRTGGCKRILLFLER